MFTVKLEDRKGWEEYGTIKKKKKKGKVRHTSSGEAEPEAVGSLRVPGQPGLLKETLSQTKQNH